jgi:hypothetical protein
MRAYDDNIRNPERRNWAPCGVHPHCKADCERRPFRAVLANLRLFTRKRAPIDAGSRGMWAI